VAHRPVTGKHPAPAIGPARRGHLQTLPYLRASALEKLVALTTTWLADPRLIRPG
jgi:hypothetical protein